VSVYLLYSYKSTLADAAESVVRAWQWLLAVNPAFKQYEASFLDEQVTGKRLVRQSNPFCL
jgi:hypothetical protein